MKAVCHTAFAAFKTNGGATCRAPSGNCNAPKAGFALALDKSTELAIRASKLSANGICAYVARHWQALTRPNAYLGLWQDGPCAYLDVSTVLRNKAKALALARKVRQKAIFNLATGQSLPV